MTIELDITPKLLPGTLHPLTHGYVRELQDSDLQLLSTMSSQAQPGHPRNALRRISSRHHALARLLAQGIHPDEAATALSYATDTVYALRQDASFKTLVKFYQDSIAKELESNFELLAGMTRDAGNLLRERMETEPEKITTGQLLEIIKTAADRSGNGPASSSVQVNINMGIADRMKAAREAARRAIEPKVIEGTAVAA